MRGGESGEFEFIIYYKRQHCLPVMFCCVWLASKNMRHQRPVVWCWQHTVHCWCWRSTGPNLQWQIQWKWYHSTNYHTLLYALSQWTHNYCIRGSKPRDMNLSQFAMLVYHFVKRKFENWHKESKPIQICRSSRLNCQVSFVRFT